MISAWWLAAAIPAGIITGFALCLVIALFGIHDLPMEGGRYTGNLDDVEDDGSDGEFDDIIRDWDNHKDVA